MKPDPKLIDSMAMRYRHDFSFLDETQKDSIRTTMTQLWEEVVGLGFYKAEKTITSTPKPINPEPMKLKIKFNPCFFGHNWTKWEQRNANMVRLVDGQCISYIATKQLRTCKDCGYMQKQKL